MCEPQIFFIKLEQFYKLFDNNDIKQASTKEQQQLNINILSKSYNNKSLKQKIENLTTTTNQFDYNKLFNNKIFDRLSKNPVEINVENILANNLLKYKNMNDDNNVGNNITLVNNNNNQNNISSINNSYNNNAQELLQQEPNIILEEQQGYHQQQQVQQQVEQVQPHYNNEYVNPEIVLEQENFQAQNNNEHILKINEDTNLQQNIAINDNQQYFMQENLQTMEQQQQSMNEEQEEEQENSGDLVEKIKNNITVIEENVSSMIEKENIILEMLDNDIKKNSNMIENLTFLRDYYTKSKNIFKKKKKNLQKYKKKELFISEDDDDDNDNIESKLNTKNIKKYEKKNNKNINFMYKKHKVYIDNENNNREQKYYYLNDDDEKIYYKNNDVKKIENLLIKFKI